MVAVKNQFKYVCFLLSVCTFCSTIAFWSSRYDFAENFCQCLPLELQNKIKSRLKLKELQQSKESVKTELYEAFVKASYDLKDSSTSFLVEMVL
jgi:hypothetical protein